MATIVKMGQSNYLVTLTDKKEELGRIECYQLKHEIAKIIRPGREISLDITGVKIIKISGYKILRELKHLADSRRCKFQFINVEEGVTNKIAGITGKKLVEHN